MGRQGHSQDTSLWRHLSASKATHPMCCPHHFLPSQICESLSLSPDRSGKQGFLWPWCPLVVQKGLFHPRPVSLSSRRTRAHLSDSGVAEPPAPRRALVPSGLLRKILLWSRATVLREHVTSGMPPSPPLPLPVRARGLGCSLMSSPGTFILQEFVYVGGRKKRIKAAEVQDLMVLYTHSPTPRRHHQDSAGAGC
jgi:hypothetical protein